MTSSAGLPWSLLSEHKRGILVTVKRDGRPQLSNVGHTFDADRQLIRISVTAGRAKTRNLRRDPRASYYLTSADMNAYLGVDADAELSPVALDPADPVVDELVDMYRLIAGEHGDWDGFRTAMVADDRLVLKLWIKHAYGFAQ
ncbi:MAG: PPOX class F420-dependent oxidoreductase [Actinomycetota bacterium]|nr:PPOX class F420-dependent oxidoreductase [Actinomycetota bacterium]